MKIHPTAIVSPQARMADDVEIGAAALIGDQVTLGPGCVVQAHAILEGKTTLGADNFVGYGAILGTPPQDFAFESSVFSEVRIGDGNTFREYATVHRGTKEGTATVVGNGCYLMVGAHLGHNVQLGDKVIIANNCLLGGYVEVADGAVLGGGAVFHQFVRVGRLVMVCGGARFSKDIPPYLTGDRKDIVAGLNAIGLRRAGFSAEVRNEIKRAFKLIYWSGLNVSQAVEKSHESKWGPEAAAFLAFCSSSKRGISRTERDTAADES
jgi:UDP-N-acetylglucosamine acyltransferase